MRSFSKILLAFSSISIILAQGGGSIGVSDARSAAMGKSYTTSSRGVYAVGKNPANLSIETGRKFEIASVLPLPNMNMKLGADFLNVEEFNYFFAGVRGDDGNLQARELTQSDKERFRALFNSGSNITSSFSTSLFAISFYAGRETGAFAFSIEDRTSIHGALPVDFIDFVMFGNEIGRSYNFESTELKSWYLREYSITYSREINEIFPELFDSFSFGVTSKLIHGFWYTSIEKLDSYLKTRDDYSIEVNSDLKFLSAFSPDFGVKYDFEGDVEKHSNIGLFPSPAGTGFGFDLGFSGKLDKAWTVGLAITDIGSISWSSETVEYSSNKNYILEDVTTRNNIDSLNNVIKGEGRKIEGFSTALATAFRIGVAYEVDKTPYKPRGELLIVAEYNQGFNNMPSNSTTPRFSVGAEWLACDWLALRNGFSFGGRDNFKWGFGFGIDSGLIEFNFATTDLQSLLAGSSLSRLGVAFGSRWKF